MNAANSKTKNVPGRRKSPETQNMCESVRGGRVKGVPKTTYLQTKEENTVILKSLFDR